MLSAKEANKIARSEVLQVMNLIRESAYRGGFSITLRYFLPREVIETLKDYGYEVKETNDPMFMETPYGKSLEEVVGHEKLTIISWT